MSTLHIDVNRVTRYREFVYGYVDCSDAPKIAQNYMGCGVPIPKFDCTGLSEAAEKCMNMCEKQAQCEYISIYEARDKCYCSLRTGQSLIAASRVVNEQPTNQEQYFCNEFAMADSRREFKPNCDGDKGCVYKKNTAFTIAKDANSWAYVDTCKVQLPPHLRKGSKKDGDKPRPPFGDKMSLLPPMDEDEADVGAKDHKRFPGHVKKEKKEDLGKPLGNVKVSDIPDELVQKAQDGDETALQQIQDLIYGKKEVDESDAEDEGVTAVDKAVDGVESQKNHGGVNNKDFSANKLKSYQNVPEDISSKNKGKSAVADKAESAVADKGKSAVADKGKSAVADKGKSAVADKGKSAVAVKGKKVEVKGLSEEILGDDGTGGDPVGRKLGLHVNPSCGCSLDLESSGSESCKCNIVAEAD